MFYKFDGNLLRFPITSTAKICYMILSDRLALSKANGWKDGGGYYVLFSNNKMAAMLGISRRQTINIYNELCEQNLIKVVHILGEAKRIYINPVPENELDTQDATRDLEDEIRAAGHAEGFTLQQPEVDEILSRLITKLSGVSNRTGYIRKTVRNFRREKINGRQDIPDTTYDLSDYESTNAIIEEGY